MRRRIMTHLCNSMICAVLIALPQADCSPSPRAHDQARSAQRSSVTNTAANLNANQFPDQERLPKCEKQELCEVYWRSNAVFIGKVIEIRPVTERSPRSRPSQNQRWPTIKSRVRFRVEKKYKGVKENEVEIENLIDEDGQSYEFALGERYLVSVGARFEKMIPHLIVDACSQTKLVSQATEEIKFLEEESGKYADWASSFGAFRGGILQGKAISLPQPTYPPLARQAKVAGRVYVMLVIDEQGRAIKAEAVCGDPLLKPAAEEAGLKVRYSPLRLSGKPVKVSGVIVYNFVSQ